MDASAADLGALEKLAEALGPPERARNGCRRCRAHRTKGVGRAMACSHLNKVQVETRVPTTWSCLTKRLRASATSAFSLG